MEYEVRFGALRVGNAHMEVVALDNVRGRHAWHTAFWVQGGNFLYRVNDVYESWMDAETLSSLRFVQELEEGGKDTERRFEIYPERAVFIQTSKKPAKEEKSVTQPLDDGSFLYFMRTIPLEVGQTYDFDRYFRPDRNPVQIRVLRKEKRQGAGRNLRRDRRPAGDQDQGNFLGERSRRDLALRRRAAHHAAAEVELKFGSLNLYLKSYFPSPSQ